MTSAVPTAEPIARRPDSASGWNGTSTASRTVARVVLASAGVAAAAMVLSRPDLRRVAARLVRVWLGTSVPMYLLAEIGRAWVESSASAARSSR